MVEYDRSAPSEASGKDPFSICIAGVGGAGSNVLDRISIDRSVDAKLVTFQSDIRVLNRTNVTNRVQLGTDLMRGVGAGGDPDLGREAALFSKNEIRDALDGHEMVFISAGLGGGTGSGAAPVIAEIAIALARSWSCLRRFHFPSKVVVAAFKRVRHWTVWPNKK